MPSTAMKLYVRGLQEGCLAWSPDLSRLLWLNQHYDTPEILISKPALVSIARPAKINLTAPTTICWAATNKCNLACDYCLGTKEILELDLHDQTTVLQNILASDVLSIDFSGGEPLLLGNLFNFMEMIKRRGRGITITTNGTFLTRYASRLASFVDFVRISIDGSCAESHDKSRGLPGLLGEILRGIELLHFYSVPVRVNTVVMKTNFNEIEDIVRLVKSVGVAKISLLQYLSIGQTAHKPNYRVGGKEFLELGRSLQAKYEDEAFKVGVRDTERAKGYTVVRANGYGYANHNLSANSVSDRQILLGNLLEERLDVLWRRVFGSSVVLDISGLDR